VSLLTIVILAVVQGLAELLPVSSSAHVVVAEKLMGIDPSLPKMTLLLVMLHTGTMGAVIVYFWREWSRAFFRDMASFQRFAGLLILATMCTGIVGEALILGIERVWLRGTPNAEVEALFGHLELIAPALAAVGILILIAGLRGPHILAGNKTNEAELTAGPAAWIGIVQGVCLPFRGFSRSGATISTGMLGGVAKARAEEFSFALAVVLTPLADGRELLRLMKTQHLTGSLDVSAALVPGAIGACCAFVAGLLALRWLSRWLENGKWYIFGIYCLAAGAVAAALHVRGY
jgi:undecaprenyl-diphosphatase